MGLGREGNPITIVCPPYCGDPQEPDRVAPWLLRNRLTGLESLPGDPHTPPTLTASRFSFHSFSFPRTLGNCDQRLAATTRHQYAPLATHPLALSLHFF